jgi:sulfate transport system ATP-binding protein
MSFVGAVNVVPRAALQGQDPGPFPSDASRVQQQAEAEPVFIRPHDVQVYTSPQAGSVPAQLRRLRHMGRDLQAELVLSNGEVLMAQFPREQIDYQAIKPGDGLHIVSRQVRSFEPDYMI